jgi:hypothetical protein
MRGQDRKTFGLVIHIEQLVCILTLPSEPHIFDQAQSLLDEVQNGTSQFQNVNGCLNTNIYSYLETPAGQSSNVYLSVVHFFNTSIN